MMFSEQFFDLLLDFGDDWKVNQVSVNSLTEEVDVTIEFISKVAEDPDTLEGCPIYDHAPIRRWRHLDTMQYKTFINSREPRVKGSDGKIKTISVPWSDKHERHTYLFERLAIDVLKSTKNQTKSSELLRCGFGVINRIIHNAVNRGILLRPDGYIPEHLSVDEKSFKKGHEYVTVLSDPISGVVLDVSKGRDHESCQSLIMDAIKPEHRGKVKTVSMDMWKAYMKATQELLPNAEIVHDRFHMVKHLNDAIDKVRRREVKQHEVLKNTRYVFLKNHQNLTDQQRMKFAVISHANYEVSRAWRIKENFRDIFGCDSIQEASELVIQWVHDAIKSNIKEMIKVVDTFKNHIRGIINAMVTSFSNSMAERLNGKIQEIKSTARGYRRFENFKSAILFFHGGLYLYPLKYR
jgi:transposase